MIKTQIIILAAGQGKRLLPLTKVLPKTMLKVDDIPIIDHILNSINLNLINEILIAVGHNKNIVMNHLKNGDIKFNQTTKLFEYNPTKNAENAIKDKFLYNKHGQLAFGRRIGATTVDSLLNKVNRNLSSVDLSNLDPAKAAVNAHTSLGDTLKSDMKYSQIRKALSGAALYTIGGGAAGAAFGSGFGGIAGGVAGGALGGVHMIASTVAYKHKKHDMSNQLMRIVKADYPQVQFGVHPSSSLGHIDSGLGGDFVTPIHLGNAFNCGGGGSGGSSFFDGFSFDVSL